MFPQMTAILAPQKQGIAEIDHYTVTPLQSRMSALRRGAYCPEGRYATLRVGRTLMMSDTMLERRSNREVVTNSRGDVLIAGLGLGMILHPILARAKVQSVTVVEKYQDVIDLVLPTLPAEKLTIICADIHHWTPEKAARFSTIYFDIWPDICTDNLEAIKQLHRRFRRYLLRDGEEWMGSWQHEELKRLKRSGK